MEMQRCTHNVSGYRGTVHRSLDEWLEAKEELRSVQKACLPRRARTLRYALTSKF